MDEIIQDLTKARDIAKAAVAFAKSKGYNNYDIILASGVLILTIAQKNDKIIDAFCSLIKRLQTMCENELTHI